MYGIACKRCWTPARIPTGRTPTVVTPLMVAIDISHTTRQSSCSSARANPHLWDWWGRTAL